MTEQRGRNRRGPEQRRGFDVGERLQAIRERAEQYYEVIRNILSGQNLTPDFQDDGNALARWFRQAKEYFVQHGLIEDEGDEQALSMAFDMMQNDAILNNPADQRFREKGPIMRSVWDHYKEYKQARLNNTLGNPNAYFAQVHSELGQVRGEGGAQWRDPQVRGIFEMAYDIDTQLDRIISVRRNLSTDEVNDIRENLEYLQELTRGSKTGVSETELVATRLQEKFDMYLMARRERIENEDIEYYANLFVGESEADQFRAYARALNSLLKKVRDLRSGNETLYSLTIQNPEAGRQHQAELRSYLQAVRESEAILSDSDIEEYRDFLIQLHTLAVSGAMLYLGETVDEVPEIFTDDVRFWLLGRYNSEWKTVQRYWAIYAAEDTALLTDYDRGRLENVADRLEEAIDELLAETDRDVAFARRYAAIDILRNRIETILDEMDAIETRRNAPPPGDGDGDGNGEDEGDEENLDQGLKLWREFLREYGKGADGRPLPREIINSTEEEAVVEQGRAFMRWVKDVWWEKVADPPNPFLPGFDMKNYKLGRMSDHPTVIDLVESIPVLSAIRGIFGVMRILEKGSNSYKHQLKPGDQYQAYDEYKTNYLEHLFKIGEMGTGALPMARYIQWGVQCISLHDLARREQYKRLLQPHYGGQYEKIKYNSATKQIEVVGMGEDMWRDFFTDGGNGEKKYGGHPIHDVFYEEFSNLPKSVTEEVVDRIATFILLQDRRYSTGELTYDDAQFAAVVAINATEYFGILDTSDTSRISRRIKARFSFLSEYRERKRGAKELGAQETYHWFRKFLENILRSNLNPKTGVSMETVWLLSGFVTDEDRQRYGLPTSVENVDFSAYTQEMGNVYRRLAEFVQKIYGVITRKEGLGVDWTATSVEGLMENVRKLRGIKNDVVDYYFSDIEVAASMNSEEKELVKQGNRTEAERRMWQRTATQRANFAQNGYLLVRGLKLDKESGKYKDPNNQLTSDPNRAAVEYKFTPAITFFNILRDANNNPVSPNSILLGPNGANASFEGWLGVQTQIEQALSSHDTFGRMRLEMVKWLVIDEMADKKKKFHALSAEDKGKILDGLFAGLSQDAHDIRYINLRNIFDEVEFAPFGQFTFDDVVEILEEAKWIRPLDVGLKLQLRTRRFLPTIAAQVVPEPET